MSLRTLFRAIDDATRERTAVQEDAGYADVIRRTVANLSERMATVVREFGRVLVSGARSADGAERDRLTPASRRSAAAGR